MVLSLMTCGARDTSQLDDLRPTQFPHHCVIEMRSSIIKTAC